MEDTTKTVTSSGRRITRNYGHSYCLICCSACEPQCDDVHVSDLKSNLKLEKAIKKIFEYLIIPQQDFIKLSKSKSKLYFCSSCLVFVKEIIELEEKIEILELRIKWNAEILGRIAVNTPAVPKVMKNRNAVSEIWSIFKGPVTQNYLHGALPNPYVKLTKGVDVRTKEVLPKGIENAGIGSCTTTREDRGLHSLQPSSTSNCHFDNTNDYKGQESTKDFGDAEGEKSTTYFCMDEIKSEMGYNIDTEIEGSSINVKTELDLGENHSADESSDDDLFEPVLVPVKITLKSSQKNTQECGSEKNIFKNEEKSPAVTKIENFEDSDDDLFEAFIVPRKTSSMLSEQKNRLEENSRETNELDGRIESITSSSAENTEESVIPYAVQINKCDELQLRTAKDSSTLHTTSEETLRNAELLEFDKVPDRNATSITDSETTDGKTLEPNSKPQYSPHRRSSPSYTENSEARYPQKESCAAVHTGSRAQEKEIAGMGTISEEKLVEVDGGRRTRPIRASAPKSFKHFMYSDEEENSSESDLESHDGDDSFSEFEMEVDSGNDNNSDSDESFSKSSDRNSRSKSGKSGKFTADASELLKLPKKFKDKLDTEGKDYLKCPKCDFFTSLSRSKPSAVRKARRKISAHYTIHIPVKLTDISKTINDEYCYKCTKCSFTVDINESDVKKGTNKESYHRLSLHYMDLHDGPFVEDSTTTIDPLTDLVEAVDYFRCPQTGCKYFVLIDKEKTSGKNPVVLGRYRILSHYNSFHNPELKAAMVKPVLDEADGTVCFKCPKCDFKNIVKTDPDGKFVSSGESDARKKMKFHYTIKHITPWQNFPGLYPFKCSEEKLGEDDIVRCIYSPTDCDYFVKINYVEGKSRAKCRYAAYTSVRTHAWHHDPSRKHHFDKGYSCVLPLYKGNKKVSSVPLKKVVLKGNTGKHTASTVPIQAKTTTDTSATFESHQSTNTDAAKIIPNEAEMTDAVVPPRLMSPTVTPNQVENQDKSSIEENGSLRRSKRTSAIKRKRYNLDNFVENGKDCDNEYSPEEERCMGEDSDNEKDLRHKSGTSFSRKVSGRGQEDSKLSTANSSEEYSYNTDKEHYRCWKCSFYSELESSSKRSASCSHYLARHKLNIHFNSTHCVEELAFRDPDRLLIEVDGKEWFTCPRCEYREEIVFNPKKHADKIQGRKNARVKLGRHFFFIHCVPESLKGSNPGDDLETSTIDQRAIEAAAREEQCSSKLPQVLCDADLTESSVNPPEECGFEILPAGDRQIESSGVACNEVLSQELDVDVLSESEVHPTLSDPNPACRPSEASELISDPNKRNQ